jgi:hypothetical protein
MINLILRPERRIVALTTLLWKLRAASATLSLVRRYNLQVLQLIPH